MQIKFSHQFIQLAYGKFLKYKKIDITSLLYLLYLKPCINHSLILYYHHKKNKRWLFTSKVYNTQEDFAINFNKFVLNIYPKARKTQLNILPYILFGMTKAESSVASDIARELEDKFDFVQHDSNVKGIRRFYNNKLFDGENFYDALIKHVIFNYNKDFRVHIIIDHMFSHDDYTTLMMSMRVGKQGIPLWFKSFKGKKLMMPLKKV